MLGWILERAGGKAFNQLFSEYVWQHIRAEFDGYVTVDRYGAPRTAGGICVTLRDLARFGQMFLQRGNVNGNAIVADTWIDDTINHYDRAAWDAHESVDSLPVCGYRNKWWITGNTQGAYTGIGVYGQWLYIAPEKETVIAVFASQPLPVDDAIGFDAVRCFEAIAAAL